MRWFRTESEIRGLDGRLIASGDGSVADVLERAVRDGVNLSGADLRGQDLSRRSLASARLECADLAGANLTHADLSRAVLEEANLSGATLRHTHLEETNFRRAHAESADFGSASGREPDFMEANLVRADLSGAHLPSAVFIRANLGGVVAVELRAEGAVFRFAAMERADVAGADLSRSDLGSANLFRANLTRAIVAGASFENARLVAAVTDGVDLASAITRGAEFGKRAGAGPGRRQLEALVATGHFPEALDAIELAFRGRQLPPQFEFIAAMAHEGLGDFDRAAECYSRAGRLAPTDARYPRELARILVVLGRPSEAAVAYAREAQLTPGQPLPIARAAAARALARGATRLARPISPERATEPQPEPVESGRPAPVPAAETPALVSEPHESRSGPVVGAPGVRPEVARTDTPGALPAAWDAGKRIPMSVSAWRDEAVGRDLALVRFETADVPDETFRRLFDIARSGGGRYGRSPEGERGFVLAPETAREFVSRFGVEVAARAPGLTPREKLEKRLTDAARALEESPPADLHVGQILDRVAGIEEARLAIHAWLDGKLLPAERDPLRSLPADDLLDWAAREDEAVRTALARAGLGPEAKRVASAPMEVSHGF